MPRVSGSIPSFINGVSQQSPALRLPNQGERQDNFYSTIVSGMKKRPPTEFMARIIPNLLSASPVVHLIDRDEAEKYVAVWDGGYIRVFDFAGNEKSVSAPYGWGYLAGPGNHLRFLTVADYTFVVNRNVPVLPTAYGFAPRPYEAVVNVQAGNYGRTYRIDINGTTFASYTTPNGDNANQAPAIATTVIAVELYNQLVAALAPSGWGFGIHQNAIHIISPGSDFGIAGFDGVNGNAMKVCKGSVRSFSDLPRFGPHGFVIEVEASEGTEFDNYWVYADKGGTNSNSAIRWRECAKPGATVGLNWGTMPHVLRKNPDGSFTFTQATWDDRKCGDGVKISPDPSFVGQAIQDIVYFRNRLGFLADENVVLSRAGSVFDFFRTTATALLDDDPIDLSAAHIKVSFLRAAVPYQEQLILFSTQTQFRLSAQDLLTAKTASIKQLAEYTSSSLCKPIVIGESVYFVTNPGLPNSFASIYEMSYDKRNDRLSSSEITAHVPSYIPSGVYKLAGSVDESALVALTTGDPTALYVYRYYFSGDEKVQASWSRWAFDNAVVLDAVFVNSELYVLLRRGVSLTLERLRMDTAAKDPTLAFSVHLDCRQSIGFLDYDAARDVSRFFVPVVGSGPAYVVLKDGPKKLTGFRITEFSPSGTGGFVGTVPGNHYGRTAYFGHAYRSEYELTEVFYRENNGQQVAVNQDGRLQLLDLALVYDTTSFFKVRVETEGRDPEVHVFSPAVVGSPATVVGDLGISDGRWTVPINSDSRKVRIFIENDTWQPSGFVAASWRGVWNPTARNV